MSVLVLCLGQTVITLNAEGLAGFEYELAKKYADYIGVDLKIVPSYHLDELFLKLDTGKSICLPQG